MKVAKHIYKIASGPVGFIASIITVVLAFNTDNEYVNAGIAIVAMLYIISVTIYVLKSLLDVKKARYELEQSSLNRSGHIASAMHNYYHNLRDYTSSVYSTEKLTIRDVKESCKSICGYIAEIYRRIFGDYLGNNNVSVCIKLIKTESMFDENYMNWKMETIARDVATVQERSKKDKKTVRVADNTVFQIIISDNYDNDLFFCPDMRNIKTDFLQRYKKEYKNSRGGDYIKYYRSTIVVPVKIDCTHISKKIVEKMKEKDKRSLILGFLCIDSMKVFETKQEKRIFWLGANYAKSIADSLYLFFEKVLISNIEHDRMINNNCLTCSSNNKKQRYNKNRRGRKNENIKKSS